jgi:enoyl-CoA hydratase
MDALTIRRDDYGPPSKVVRMQEVPVPRLNPEDATSILVAVLCTGPNFNTNFAALGLPVPVFGRGESDTIHIPGSDALGIVVDAGPAVRQFKVGQAVILDSWTDQTLIRGYETHDGFNAQFAVVDAQRAVAVPPELKKHKSEQLAAVLLTYGTAYRAVVERLAVNPGESILLMGGGKGTSFAGAQIAKTLGARVILMGSNTELGKSLIDRGIADAFIDRRRIQATVFGVIPVDEPYERWRLRTEPFREAVCAANDGRPVDRIFEHTGGSNFPLLVSALAENGSIVFFGATGRGLKGEYKETFFYDGRRYVMDARWVWMRQKQLILRSSPAEEIFKEIGLRPGRKGLIWGADAYAFEFVKAALARKAELAVLASFRNDAGGIKALIELGIDESHVIDRDAFDLIDDMPDPLTEDGRPDPQYGSQYMTVARQMGRRVWDVFGPRISPDFIVERTDQSTLHYSTFLLRDFNERDDMPEGVIVVRGSRSLSIRGSHMYRSSQAVEAVRLLAQGKIVMEKDDLEIVALESLPDIQQKMLDGRMEKPKGVARVQAESTSLTIGGYENAFFGDMLVEADPDRGRYLDIHVASQVGIIVLKRVAALNALNRDLLSQLAGAVRDIGASGTIKGKPVKALIICSGLRAFVAGADVNEFVGSSDNDIEKIARYNLGIFEDIENLGMPVISVIDGFALGGGNELAMSTAYRIVTENARIGQPEIKLGIIPGYGALQRLPRLVGPRRAAEMSVNGESIDGRRAVAIGLADEVAPSATALKQAFRTAREFISGRRSWRRKAWDELAAAQQDELRALMKSAEAKALAATPALKGAEAQNLKAARSYAARYVFEAIRYGYENGFAKGLENDALLFGLVAASESGQAWIRRFLEKDPRQGAFLTLLTPQEEF